MEVQRLQHGVKMGLKCVHLKCFVLQGCGCLASAVSKEFCVQGGFSLAAYLQAQKSLKKQVGKELKKRKKGAKGLKDKLKDKDVKRSRPESAEVCRGIIIQ